MNILKRIKSYFQNRGLYVTLDPNDNSVTFSKQLYKLLKPDMKNSAKIIVAKAFNAMTEDTNIHCAVYCFMLNPAIEAETQLANVQYNSKFDCYGFECLVPTVNYIFNDNRLPAFKPQRFKVIPSKNEWGTYYLMFPPTASR